MQNKVIIFGKNTWPYTTEAREAYAKKQKDVEYVNVLDDAKQMKTMLKYSKGSRNVPVIVEQERVTIGFNGKSWGVWTNRPGAGKDEQIQKPKYKFQINHNDQTLKLCTARYYYA